MKIHVARIVKAIVYLLVVSLLVVTALEVSLRGFFAVKNRLAPPSNTTDEYFGWTIEANVNSSMNSPVYGFVHYTTEEYGFRRYESDPSEGSLRILVLGDSYTQARMISDGDTYYDVLAENIPEAAFFVYGAAGYGSLQEYLQLDAYVDDIRPDLVLWQFCNNDIINNLLELESASYSNNNRMVRPYWIDGKIQRRFPEQDYGALYSLAKRSYILRLLDLRLDALKAKRIGSIESELHPDHPLLQASLQTTTEIMTMVRQRLGDVPCIAFTASDPFGDPDFFRTACEAAVIHYIDGVPATIRRAQSQGEIVDFRPTDPHWNANGHRIAAYAILEYLHNNGFVSDRFTAEEKAELQRRKRQRLLESRAVDFESNLLINGSFEEWVSGAPKGWVYNGIGNIEKSSEAVDGLAALKFGPFSSEIKTVAQVHQYIRSPRITSGTSIEVVVDAFAYESAKLGFGVYASIDGKQTLISPSEVDSAYGWINHPGDGKWRTLRTEVHVPESAEVNSIRMVIIFRDNSQAHALVDRAFVSLLPPAEGEED